MQIPDKGKIMKSFRRFLRFIRFCNRFNVRFPQRIFAQSRPQKPDASTGNNKRNQRPAPKTEEELKKEEEKRKLEEEEKNAVFTDEVVKVETNIVNVDAVVFNKKTGQIVTGLKKGKFCRL
jgi:hypothetical protein